MKDLCRAELFGFDASVWERGFRFDVLNWALEIIENKTLFGVGKNKEINSVKHVRTKTKRMRRRKREDLWFRKKRKREASFAKKKEFLFTHTLTYLERIIEISQTDRNGRGHSAFRQPLFGRCDQTRDRTRRSLQGLLFRDMWFTDFETSEEIN